MKSKTVFLTLKRSRVEDDIPVVQNDKETLDADHDNYSKVSRSDIRDVDCVSHRKVADTISMIGNGYVDTGLQLRGTYQSQPIYINLKIPSYLGEMSTPCQSQDGGRLLECEDTLTPDEYLDGKHKERATDEEEHLMDSELFQQERNELGEVADPVISSVWGKRKFVLRNSESPVEVDQEIQPKIERSELVVSLEGDDTKIEMGTDEDTVHINGTGSTDVGFPLVESYKSELLLVNLKMPMDDQDTDFDPRWGESKTLYDRNLPEVNQMVTLDGHPSSAEPSAGQKCQSRYDIAGDHVGTEVQKERCDLESLLKSPTPAIDSIVFDESSVVLQQPEDENCISSKQTETMEMGELVIPLTDSFEEDESNGERGNGHRNESADGELPSDERQVDSDDNSVRETTELSVSDVMPDVVTDYVFYVMTAPEHADVPQETLSTTLSSSISIDITSTSEPESNFVLNPRDEDLQQVNVSKQYHDTGLTGSQGMVRSRPLYICLRDPSPTAAAGGSDTKNFSKVNEENFSIEQVLKVDIAEVNCSSRDEWHPVAIEPKDDDPCGELIMTQRHSQGLCEGVTDGEGKLWISNDGRIDFDGTEFEEIPNDGQNMGQYNKSAEVNFQSVEREDNCSQEITLTDNETLTPLKSCEETRAKGSSGTKGSSYFGFPSKADYLRNKIKEKVLQNQRENEQSPSVMVSERDVPQPRLKLRDLVRLFEEGAGQGSGPVVSLQRVNDERVGESGTDHSVIVKREPHEIVTTKEAKMDEDMCDSAVCYEVMYPEVVDLCTYVEEDKITAVYRDTEIKRKLNTFHENIDHMIKNTVDDTVMVDGSVRPKEKEARLGSRKDGSAEHGAMSSDAWIWNVLRSFNLVDRPDEDKGKFDQNAAVEVLRAVVRGYQNDDVSDAEGQWNLRDILVAVLLGLDHESTKNDDTGNGELLPNGSADSTKEDLINTVDTVPLGSSLHLGKKMRDKFREESANLTGNLMKLKPDVSGMYSKMKEKQENERWKLKEGLLNIQSDLHFSGNDQSGEDEMLPMKSDWQRFKDDIRSIDKSSIKEALLLLKPDFKRMKSLKPNIGGPVKENVEGKLLEVQNLLGKMKPEWQPGIRDSGSSHQMEEFLSELKQKLEDGGQDLLDVMDRDTIVDVLGKLTPEWESGGSESEDAKPRAVGNLLQSMKTKLGDEGWKVGDYLLRLNLNKIQNDAVDEDDSVFISTLKTQLQLPIGKVGEMAVKGYPLALAEKGGILQSLKQIITPKRRKEKQAPETMGYFEEGIDAMLYPEESDTTHQTVKEDQEWMKISEGLKSLVESGHLENTENLRDVFTYLSTKVEDKSFQLDEVLANARLISQGLDSGEFLGMKLQAPKFVKLVLDFMALGDEQKVKPMPSKLEESVQVVTYREISSAGNESSPNLFEDKCEELTVAAQAVPGRSALDHRKVLDVIEYLGDMDTQHQLDGSSSANLASGRKSKSRRSWSIFRLKRRKSDQNLVVKTSEYWPKGDHIEVGQSEGHSLIVGQVHPLVDKIKNASPRKVRQSELQRHRIGSRKQRQEDENVYVSFTMANLLGFSPVVRRNVIVHDGIATPRCLCVKLPVPSVRIFRNFCYCSFVLAVSRKTNLIGMSYNV